MTEARERSHEAADLILHNAKVHTCEPERPQAEIVVVRGDRIFAVGDEADLASLLRPGATLLDCEGATVIPGFDDAHCHPVARAIGLLGVDCAPSAVRSISDIQSRIEEESRRIPEGQWIRATGLDESRLADGRMPTRADLDAAAPGHPVVLVHATGQCCVLSSLALRRVDIGPDRADLAQRGIQVDLRTGEPTGVVTGPQEQVARAIPAPDAGEIERAMARVNEEVLSQGITSMQDVSWTNGWNQWQLWHRMEMRGVVTPRISMFAGTESLERFRAEGLRTGSGDVRLRMGALKLALDESTGVPHPPQSDVNDLALRAHEAGFQVAFHVSDVRMLASALAAIAFVRERSAVPDPHFRLEHCAIVPPALRPKIRGSGAVVVTQPAFLRCFGDQYLAEARPDQASWLCPLGSLVREGIDVAFGSDSPLVSSDPLGGIHSAIVRTTDRGRRLDPSETIGALEAIEHYTLAGARASLEAESKGSIQVGKLADLVVLSHDVAKLDPEAFAAVRVRRTIIGGRIAWEA